MTAGSYRSVAKLTVSFGLVSLPVSAIKATDDPREGMKAHQVHPEDGGRIKFSRYCSVCKETIAYEDIGKGVETPEGVIIITDEDMEHLPISSSKDIEITQFSSEEEISPIMYKSNYYLEPDGQPAARAYALILAALAKSNRVGIGKVTLREGREHLAALRVEDNKLMLTTLLWPEEVRHVHFDSLDGVEVTGSTLKMAIQLVNSLTKPFDPTEFKNEYRAAFEELVAAKKAGEIPAAIEPKKSAPGLDLEAMLKASLSAVS